jgi:hypothetical protein
MMLFKGLRMRASFVKACQKDQSSALTKRQRASITGRVQGVGFQPATERKKKVVGAAKLLGSVQKDIVQ